MVRRGAGSGDAVPGARIPADDVDRTDTEAINPKAAPQHLLRRGGGGPQCDGTARLQPDSWINHIRHPGMV